MIEAVVIAAAIVAAAAYLIARAFRRKPKAGCGGRCGCPATAPKKPE